MPSDLLFAKYAPVNMEPKNSIGAKWQRMIDRMPLKSVVEGKRVALKMHLGGGVGFSTVHPFFVRRLVKAIWAAGAKDCFATDGQSAVKSAVERGYTNETIGCRLVPTAGTTNGFYYERPVEPPIEDFKTARLVGEVVDADALVDLSHVKGHGDASFGGASKNLSMGCVTQPTRAALHGLEGYIEWDAEKCTHCGKCAENCEGGAISFDKEGVFKVFWHHCKLCQHCVLICPTKALTMTGGRYETFQKAMAKTSAMALGTFEPEHTYFINFLTQITAYCDCWGMTTPALVPDIGILAGGDIVAIEQASLDLIRHEDLIPGTLPPGTELGDKGHLFERVHGKDPYEVVKHLAEYGLGSREYKLVEVD